MKSVLLAIAIIIGLAASAEAARYVIRYNPSNGKWDVVVVPDYNPYPYHPYAPSPYYPYPAPQPYYPVYPHYHNPRPCPKPQPRPCPNHRHDHRSPKPHRGCN